MNKQILMTLRFRKWSWRKPLECEWCGAAIVSASAHARWHAHIEQNAPYRPNPGMWGETTLTTKQFSISIGEDGFPIS